ncbi:Annexin [Aspergillus fijiensis CBS 313.89]|uniref:Annexin n=1 Tax=Aspergillus fijiensis CBS 313.89 TaxID=1448319 RepID=A0A8G1RHY2_9EURO|nr:Annexin [Aspergillus fijiensis CBS 313.89]RAK73139.1 Annexin [Aspergillus fijiensis CBS 313.89]
MSYPYHQPPVMHSQGPPAQWDYNQGQGHPTPYPGLHGAYGQQPSAPGWLPPPGGAQQHGYPANNNYQYPPPPPQQQGYGPPPAFPSLGYAPGQMAPGDFRREADALRKAMKGFGTDEKGLIAVLARLDPLQVAAVRATYQSHIRRDLYADVKSETSGYFRQGLLAIIDGPLAHDTALAREAVQGIGTKEWLLNEVLLGRSNADIRAIQAAYERTYRGRSLQQDVADDLSFKTKTLFTAVLRAARHEESMPIDYRLIESEAQNIHGATAARIVNNADEVTALFARTSDNELRALNQAFASRYHLSLESHIEKEFSGHMKDALLYMLRTALDPAMRDAVLLEEAMKGMGTKDNQLVVRVVRLHWNRQHMEIVKRAYHHRFRTDLIQRVKGETSGDYQRLLVAMLE